MEKRITYCDICGEETKIMKNSVPIIFTTEQTEGRSCKPYIQFSRIDICTVCDKHILDGNFVFGVGAQGHNNYTFKDLSEIQQLRHFKDTVIGLWATDRPDLFTEEAKNKFHLFQLK